MGFVEWLFKSYESGAISKVVFSMINLNLIHKPLDKIYMNITVDDSVIRLDAFLKFIFNSFKRVYLHSQVAIYVHIFTKFIAIELNV